MENYIDELYCLKNRGKFDFRMWDCSQSAELCSETNKWQLSYRQAVSSFLRQKSSEDR